MFTHKKTISSLCHLKKRFRRYGRKSDMSCSFHGELLEITYAIPLIKPTIALKNTLLKFIKFNHLFAFPLIAMKAYHVTFNNLSLTFVLVQKLLKREKPKILKFYFKNQLFGKIKGKIVLE